jgi:geranylgeranyl pyrophosphate synthase
MSEYQASPVAETFSGYVEARRADIETALRRVLPGPPACPGLMAEAMRYSVEAGGKRLRPLLTLAAAESVALSLDRDTPEARANVRRLSMPAACAIELIHTYSLVHDDLPAMDNDCMRRGRPTLHVVYGEALAILAGDALLAEAFALLAAEPDSDADPSLTQRKLRVLCRVGQAVGCAGMAGGQAIDLECAGLVLPRVERGAPFDAGQLRDMHQRKTGGLMRAAAVSGAIMAGGTHDQVDALDRFASELGLVFQIIDDVLDVEGTPEALGKTPGKDAASSKPTYPAMFGLVRSRALAAEGLERAEHALSSAGIRGRWLHEIARWVITRQC